MRTRLLILPLLLALACAEQAAPLAPQPAGTSSAQFSDWVHRYRVAPPEARAALETTGIALAEARRLELLKLAETSPERALQQRLPFYVYRELPPAIAALTERPIDAVAEYEVLCADGPDGEHEERRFLIVEGVRHRAAVHGRRLSVGSKEALRVHGLAFDDLLVVSDSPIRALESGEYDGKKPLVGAERCRDGESLLDTGDQVVRVCSSEEAQTLADGLAEGEQTLGPTSTLNETPDETAASSWTEGHKDVLYIRVDFSDLAGEPVTVASAQNTMDTLVNDFYLSASYGLSSVSSTITPVLRMPQTAQWYGSNNDSGQLLKDARAAANAAGFNYLDFDRDITAFKKISGFSWAGLGYIGNRGAWLNGNFTLRVSAHELGHNNGLRHANRLDTSDDSITGTGTLVEYGHPWDIMGASNATGHFTSWFKHRLNWIPASRVANVTQSGTYRLYDVQQPVTSGLQALKVARDSTRSYWLEYRPIANKVHATRGASVIFGFNSNEPSQLLDMTPETSGTAVAGREDSPLVIGRTYSDPTANVHITPTAIAATTPASLDVVVNVSPPPGAAPTLSLFASASEVATNAAVTFNANATDADGDTLTYFWDFDDGKSEGGASQVTHTWSAHGRYNVRCTVSDMKGNTTTASRLITVGNGGTTHVVSGKVLEGTQPLEGVRVISGSRWTWTDSQGVYRLTRMATGSHTLSAMKPWFRFTPKGFTNPLYVNAAVNGADFTATRDGFSVSGEVLSNGLPVAGVTVTAGVFTATTDAQGVYRLVGLPAGTYTLEATGEAPRQFKPAGFSNPVNVTGDLTGRNFAEALYSLTGQISGGGSGVTVTDGVRTTTSYLGASFTYEYRLDNVPPGSWNLIATRAGSTFTPGFTNPVTVTNAHRTGLNFTATSGTTYRIHGRVVESGVGVSGVTIAAGSTSGKTDSLGYYVLSGLAPGTYTLTPSLSPWRFSPVSRSVTITASDLLDIDFVAIPPNTPPKVVQSAAPADNPVYSVSVDLSVLGDDDLGEQDLTYTWALVSGPGAVTFSRSGTNGAKDTTATFQTVGIHTLEVTLRDQDGATATSATRVNVYPSLTQLSVSPATIAVPRDSTQTFTASARDQFGAPYTRETDWAWEVSGGGSLEAGNLPEATFLAEALGGPFLVTATLGGQSASASVQVVRPSVPEIIEQAASTMNPIAGARATLGVLAADDQGEENLLYTWRVASGSGATFEPNGTNGAKQTAVSFEDLGPHTLVVRATDADGQFAESTLELQVVRGLTSISVTPSTATTQAGTSVRLKATALDQLGAPLSPQPTFTWSVGAGATAHHGLFVSKTPGTYEVRVEAGELSANATVEVLRDEETAPPAPEPEKKGSGCGCSAGGLTPELFLLLLALGGMRSRRFSGR